MGIDTDNWDRTQIKDLHIQSKRKAERYRPFMEEYLRLEKRNILEAMRYFLKQSIKIPGFNEDILGVWGNG